MATYLNRTPSSASNRKTWTWSGWVKRGIISTSQCIFGVGSGTVEFSVFFQSDDKLTVYNYTSGTYNFRYITNQVFRDPSAWYHIVVACDTTQGSAGDRVKIYLNGSQITSFSTSTDPSQNFDTQVNLNTPHKIGVAQYGSDFYLGYIAQTILVDGTALTPSSFGSTNANGIWVPNSSPSVTYGTNGFKLDFAGTGTAADASGFGADSSGNNNHFASNSLGTNPSTTDTCSNNFATFNPLDNDTVTGAATLSEGNLVINANSNPRSGCPTTIAVSNGAWYIEGKCLSSTFEIGVFGYGDGFSFNFANHPPQGDNGYPFAYNYGGNLTINNVDSQTGVGTFTTNDILAMALDMDNNTIKFYKNGSQVGTTITDSNLSNFAPYSFYVANHTSGNTGNIFSLNTGNPAYTISSGNSDANGYGNFEYAVPSGYYALCTKNLALYGG